MALERAGALQVHLLVLVPLVVAPLSAKHWGRAVAANDRRHTGAPGFVASPWIAQRLLPAWGCPINNPKEPSEIVDTAQLWLLRSHRGPLQLSARPSVPVLDAGSFPSAAGACRPGEPNEHGPAFRVA